MLIMMFISSTVQAKEFDKHSVDLACESFMDLITPSASRKDHVESVMECRKHFESLYNMPINKELRMFYKYYNE